MALTHSNPVRGRFGQAVRALSGETYCGDQAASWLASDGALHLALADGLGHGNAAHQAAATALVCLRSTTTQVLETAFKQCDQALIGSRGVALAYVVLRGNEMLHAAVGNVRTLLLHHGCVKRLSGCRGIVGAGFNELRPELLTLTPGDWVVLFSDGLRENAAVSDLLHGAHDDPEQLAQRLLIQWARDDDDAAVLLYHHA